jgi:hypothetical protein
MIWHRGATRTTSDEFERMDRIRMLGCMCCALKGTTTPEKVEIHHIIRGNKRLGHWYTIPLCGAHHRGNRATRATLGPAVHDGMKAFRAAYGYDDLELWQRLQVMLGLDDALPSSKVYKRDKTEAEVTRG